MPLMSRTMFRSLHLYLQVCLMLLGLEPQKHTATAEKRLARVNYCGGRVLGAHHRYRSAPARSVLECATFCGADPGCQAVVFDASAAWCHLGNVIANSDCSNMELATSGMTHYQTRRTGADESLHVTVTTGRDKDPSLMSNDGLFTHLYLSVSAGRSPAEQPQVCGANQVLQGATCECAPGYRGNPCTAYIGDCEDLRTTGVTADGVYSIFPLQAWESFPVYCSFKSKARTWIMERYSPNFSFNLTWAAYRDGFGSLAGDYWLGLQKIHLLTTSKAYSLRVGVKLKNSTTLYQTYNNFAVADESNYFRLSVGPFSSTDDLGNCLQPLNGSSFSTHDSDHDGEDAINCAAQRSGGWWFRSITCSTCNPTGLLGQQGLGGDNEAFWTSDKGRLTPLKISFYLQTM
ncbi:microfibril-associated glycoprotein 4-like [Pomacea canaliculata]|nr:microfibril-associated glycoprotein 4-like [Pomacea canaliculata]